MSDSTTQLIKEKLNIADFLRGYITLQSAGRNFKAVCPFHREKSPSFMISPDRGTWHCFGCAAGGDIFEFLMRYENIEFVEALKILAEKAGVELKRTNPTEYKFAGLLYDLNNTAKDFYRGQLAKTPIAQEYLLKRGLTRETIDEFELGWAPNDPDKLTVHLVGGGSGARPEEIITAGLAFKTDRGMHMDRFRGRLMFPIHNHLGKVVGFTGRIYPVLDTGTVGKYVNSPETAIFNKSKLLYGFFKTKEHIRNCKEAFIVEGQMDFLMSYQAGVKNIVASSGTAFTGDHLTALRRFADELIFNFDNDEAGWAAGERAIELAQAQGFGTKIVTLPEGTKDPADAVFASPEIFITSVKGARPALSVYFEKYLERGKGSSLFSREGLKKLRIILSKIKAITSPVERQQWLSECARYTGIAENLLLQEMEVITGTTASAEAAAIGAVSAPSPSKPAEKNRWDLLSQRVLGLSIASDNIESTPKEIISPALFEVYELLRKGETRSADPETDRIIQEILMYDGSGEKDEMQRELDHLINQLQMEYIKNRKTQITKEIKEAEQEGDEKRLEKALAEFASIMKTEKESREQ